MYPRSPRLLQYAYLKMADWHVALWSICHYSFPWWTNGAWALETVETKSMKGTISYFSTWHGGILEQCIRCGVHLERNRIFSFIRSAYWKRSCDNRFQFHWLLWIHPIKNLCSWHSQNGWIWKPFTMFFASNIALQWLMSTKHNKSELETSLSTQKNVSLFPLTLSWSCSKYVVLVVNIV